MVDTTKLPADLQRKVDEATAEESLAKVRKAVAEASDAENTAALNRLKATVGEPAAGPFTGDTKLSDGAALAEVNWLARIELVRVVELLMEQLLSAVGDRKTILLTSADGPPDLSHDATMTDRLALVDEAVTGAIKQSDKALGGNGDAPGTASFFGAPMAAAGLVLSSVTALLGYFRTDFTIGGSAVSIATRPLLLLTANGLRKRGLVIVMDTGRPETTEEVRKEFRGSIVDLSTGIAKVRLRALKHSAAIDAMDTQAPMTNATPVAPGDDSIRQSVDPAKREAHEQALAACRSASDLFDAFMTSLYSDVGGQLFIERALGERSLRKRLGGEAATVSLALDGAWGSHIVRKNLLSGLLGRVPVCASATVGASWAAYDFASGSFLGGCIVTERSALANIDGMPRARVSDPAGAPQKDRPLMPT